MTTQVASESKANRVQTTPVAGESKTKWIHYIMVTLLCFGGQFVPPFGQMTPYGMGILGIFIGAIWGWTALGMIWPSLIAIAGSCVMIGMNQVLAASFGSFVFVMLIFIAPIMFVMSETGAMDWIVNKLLTNKATLGKPWMTIWFLLFAAFLCGNFNPIVMALVFGQFFISICKKVGITPYTKLPTLMLLGIAYALMLGQITVPFIGTGLTLVAAFQAMFKTNLNFASYLVFMIPMGTIMVTIYVLIMRFIFRPDVSPLRNMNAEMVGESKKATRDQKLAILFFGLMFGLLILASLPFLGPIYKLFNKFGLVGLVFILICIMMLLKKEDGTVLLDFRKSLSTVAWDPALLMLVIMVMATYMNAPETGIAATLSLILTPLTQLSPYVFLLASLAFAAIITNFANNMIVIVLVMPVMYNFALATGMAPTGMMALLFVLSQFALATPAASPVTGVCYTYTEYIRPDMMTKYALMLLPILFVCAFVIGLTYSSIVF